MASENRSGAQGTGPRRLICPTHGVRMDPSMGGRCPLCEKKVVERPTFNPVGRLLNIVLLTAVLGFAAFLFIPGFLGMPQAGVLRRVSLGGMAKPLGLRGAEGPARDGRGSSTAEGPAESSGPSLFDWFTGDDKGKPGEKSPKTGAASAAKQRRNTGAENFEVIRERVPVEDRHPLSSMEEVRRRVGWKASEMKKRVDDYDPNKEMVELVLPQLARPKERLGLLVWLNAADSGAPPKALEAALKDKRIAYASPVRAGNNRPVSVRINLALDAVRTAMRSTQIDPERVYVGGISGGAKSAAKAALLYPEVFRGGLLVVGADYSRPIRRGSVTFPPGIEPGGALDKIEQAKFHSFVMITGEGDFNREPVLAIAEAMKEDGFAHVRVMTPPGLGHAMPSAAVLGDALAYLDAR